MKVGTDGIMLGAWAGEGRPGRILDLGTGCGVVALLLAQRFPGARIDAVEIDRQAAAEAERNFARSPWAGRLQVHAEPAAQFAARQEGPAWDLVVCNPPFHRDGSDAPAPDRRLARNAAGLEPADLLDLAGSLLARDGRMSLVLPPRAAEDCERLAPHAGFAIVRHCAVQTVAGRAPRRHLMEIARAPGQDCRQSTLVLQDRPGSWSPQWLDMTAGIFRDPAAVRAG